jgi:hypothetical protein
MKSKKACLKMGQLTDCARVMRVASENKALMASAANRQALETAVKPIQSRGCKMSKTVLKELALLQISTRQRVCLKI